ncbi:hypothetical protein NOR_03807 [Metarhizium rileyi]|uniref:Zn(II)2Cys6 transcription factor n=1 Tax=Metarhizium rileyi (strain RCEF 4871) TaxID=1649241 RepID=A0A162JPE4_METRR|nr:hypothetical protein NOR_03807 [Metarhizium rileyi RCEF 4871]
MALYSRQVNVTPTLDRCHPISDIRYPTGSGCASALPARHVRRTPSTRPVEILRNSRPFYLVLRTSLPKSGLPARPPRIRHDEPGCRDRRQSSSKESGHRMRGLSSHQDPVSAKRPAGGLQKAQAAPPGPSSTFSIDFSVSTEAEVDDDFETLRNVHDMAIDRLFPQDADDMSPLPDSVRSHQTTTSSSTRSHSIHDLHTKLSFNVASAESLLKAFRPMLKYFPFITLPEDTLVRQMAAEKPFVLLAILSSTSGSKTLQGHTLYDDEFRKVLGLKFVAGGERTLELLQGLLIYCAWYPFHLRPKNKQAFQFMRMAADMIHDLELDQEQLVLGTGPDCPDLTGEQQLDGIRAYMGYFYVLSSHLATWRRRIKDIEVSYTPWTARCCELLEQHGETKDDLVLAAQTRVAGLLLQASKTMLHHSSQSSEDKRIMVAGFKSELARIEYSPSFPLDASVSLRLQVLFLKMLLDSGTLLRSTRLQPFASQERDPLLSNARLRDCVHGTAALYRDLMSLDDAALSCFTLVDWNRPILATILGIRLSFRIPECPEWDCAWARTRLQLDGFLTHMSTQACPVTTATNNNNNKFDILSASRQVMAVVRDKYQKRLAAAAERERMPAGITCPMFDGSMEPYYPVWDAALSTPFTEGLSEGSDGQPVFHDLWTTMTMGWAHHHGLDFPGLT